MVSLSTHVRRIGWERKRLERESYLEGRYVNLTCFLFPQTRDGTFLPFLYYFLLSRLFFPAEPLYLHSRRPGKKAACLDVGRRGPQSGRGKWNKDLMRKRRRRRRPPPGGETERKEFPLQHEGEIYGESSLHERRAQHE